MQQTSETDKLITACIIIISKTFFPVKMKIAIKLKIIIRIISLTKAYKEGLTPVRKIFLHRTTPQNIKTAKLNYY
jgi:hypothetical protein